MKLLATIILCGTLFWSSSAMAVQPDEVLADPTLEKRARHISQGLRCVVCQNQSIDDSNAPLARDLRVIVRERLSAGDTDQQAIEYIVSRYGNFVLLKPPVAGNTLVLWFGPAAMFLIALTTAGIYIGRKQTDPKTNTAPLSEADSARVREILGGTNT